MQTYDASINRQYGQTDLINKILSILQSAGKDIDALTRSDISTFDEFHIGGISETRNLANLAGIEAGTYVLDVGSGLGGPARTLAAEFGCRVTGLDITEEFCRAAEVLTERVGLADRVEFRQGNALDMPFEASAFDVAWTQFAGMNIEDKPTLYGEIGRVLKNGGTFAFHEVMAGKQSDLHFPVLWANDASISHLRPQEEIRQILIAQGFKQVVWNDTTQHSYDWFRAMIERAKQISPPPLGMIVFAEDVPQKAANIIKNLEEERITVVQAVFELAK
jgi:SAM-dependent methyltransferase